MTSAYKQPGACLSVYDVHDADVESLPQESSVQRRNEEVQYPKGLALAMIMSAVWLSLFLVALVSYRHPWGLAL